MKKRWGLKKPTTDRGWRGVVAWGVVGMLLGTAVDGAWIAVTGHGPAWWLHMVILGSVFWAWDAVQSFRLSRAFWDLVTTIEMRPAFGQSEDEFWEDRD